MSGKIGFLVGALREEKLLTGLTDLMKHSWVDEIRYRTLEEDKKGVDIVISTKDAGDLYVQVKSSQEDARKFRKRHKLRDPDEYPPVAVIVWHDHRSRFSTEHCLGKIKDMRRDVLHHGKLLKRVY